MYCKRCGKELNSKFCPDCGTPAEPASDFMQAAFTSNSMNLNGVIINGEPTEPARNQPFYSQTWFIVLMMFCCCFPLGICLMWKYKTFNVFVRMIVTALFLIGLGVAIAA